MEKTLEIELDTGFVQVFGDHGILGLRVEGLVGVQVSGP